MALSLQQVCQTPRDGSRSIAIHRQQPISHQQFVNAVAANVALLQQWPEKQRWALYCDDALPFAIGFFALLHANKAIILPGNITADTQEKLASISDGLLSDQPLADVRIQLETANDSGVLTAIDNSNTITIFTSGSSGEPKAIIKRLHQFEHELNSLQQVWGDVIADAKVLGTVSHQHIYGLLFRVLWPLASGRCFYSEQMLDSAQIHHAALNDGCDIVWVASPAHLKRLYDGLEWPQISQKLVCVFSSGGPLPAAAAEHIVELLGKAPVEVFGSSETGGIAYRQQQASNSHWQALPTVALKVDEEQRLWVRSPHINSDNSWYATDDAVTVNESGRFLLEGRLDRIVKLEEKRLSLVALEKALVNSALISEVYCWVLPASEERLRQTLTATAVLTAAGQQRLRDDGRPALVKALKTHLQHSFELSLLPRKWRFVEQIPINAQAKIDKQAIAKLMSENAYS